ncbi:EXS-domain-containing protein [Dendrothele bispora CBS 962.96]|uniref:EXS-domain-containing protein n=1 Tax=Dendrothele bispora (strain CBS 962.96) TaxID=1314807 RepID=A0A4S8LUX7_DENBC|nr:EXS-domain-containing protein [Dendrothele bispora CBS 962.96]
MKFARYLEDTQTPEWKRAYIDYRSLKKRISACKRFQEQHQNQSASPSSSLVDLHSPEHTGKTKKEYGGEAGQAESSTSRMRHDAGMGLSELPEFKPSQGNRRRQNSSASLGRAKSIASGRKPRSNSSRRAGTLRQTPHPFGRPPPLNELKPLLNEYEVAFFDALDKELEKIETFFSNREKEMQNRTQLLQNQLKELSTHRQRYHDAHDSKLRPWSSALKSGLAANFGSLLHRQGKRHPEKLPEISTRDASIHETLPVSELDDKEERNTSKFTAFSPGNGKDHQYLPPRALDPDEYQRAKRTLKKAVLEHYRGLEMLHNYRVLNITGFRKALKKFEKVTKIPALDAYMTEKVETSAFASDKNVQMMMSEMIALYADRFVNGDEKRARKRLRAGTFYKVHHFSTFRSGLLLGVALPALVSGIYQCGYSREHNWLGWFVVLLQHLLRSRGVLPSGGTELNWNPERDWTIGNTSRYGIYAVLFAYLLRIFYSCPEHKLKLSFLLVCPDSEFTVRDTLLRILAVLLPHRGAFNIPKCLAAGSRYWLIRRVSKLLVPGVSRVEFTDFWMGDQFCSLVFTLSNLSQFVCSYVRGFDNWRQCGSTSSIWPVAFTLALLPFLIRLVQSIRRYADTRLDTHLINGGKYATGVVYYLCYYIWRHGGGQPRGVSFAVWVLFGTLYTLYATGWDLWMDWSVLRPHAKWPLLREELIYSSAVPSYYFAIVSNIVLRFTWVIYIPSRGPDMYVRLFIQGFLEMLRRWQWNFYRLENEHLGNMDQYRVTREVPLPYSFSGETSYDDDDNNDEE